MKPGLAQTETPASNLPLHLASFIGREREIAAVNRLLGTTRLVMLTGSGGCSKTRLALQVAQGLRQEYPNGVWLIDFAPLSDPSFTPQTVSSTFDLHESARAPIAEILKNYLRAKNHRKLHQIFNRKAIVQRCRTLQDLTLAHGMRQSRERLNKC